VKANRLVLLAVAGVSMLALTGCTQTADVAARVGDETVPTSDVDFLTKVQCDIYDKAAKQNAGQVQAVPVSLVRTQWVNTLVDTELNRQLAARDDLSYDRSTLRSAMDQFEDTLKQAPASDRDRARDLIESIYRGQLQVVELAHHNLSTEGVTDPTDDQVSDEVTKILADFRKGVDIEVNPQYGADDKGVAGSVDPSLSQAVSSYAKQSASAKPDATWVSQLPDDQRCG